MAARYTSYDSRSSLTSSLHSDPSSSSQFKSNKPSSSTAIVTSKPSHLTKTVKIFKPDNPGNLTSMVKKLMDLKKYDSKSRRVELVIPQELKKTDKIRGGGRGGGSTFGTLQRKLFGKEKVKALTEVKGNTRTLAMVLRSERELLSMNKDQEMEISDLKLQLKEKNGEVEKLKDLCLKQREEIKSLKNAVLFPDVMNTQLQDVLEKQGSELKQAKQIIPNLQKQVISLTDQLQCIAQDLAEVKANKYLSGSCYQDSSNSQPQTSSYDRGESSDSLEFSSGDPETPGSSDGLILEDLNPCLTPYTKTKAKEYKGRILDSAEESLSGRSTVTTARDENSVSSKTLKLCRRSEGGGRDSKSSTARVKEKASGRSEESKGWYIKAMNERIF